MYLSRYKNESWSRWLVCRFCATRADKLAEPSPLIPCVCFVISSRNDAFPFVGASSSSSSGFLRYAAWSFIVSSRCLASACISCNALARSSSFFVRLFEAVSRIRRLSASRSSLFLSSSSLLGPRSFLFTVEVVAPFSPYPSFFIRRYSFSC